MRAKELVGLLTRSLWLREGEDDQFKRLEALRGYGQIPRGKENAAVRLSDKQIASVLMGFAGNPAMAGHVALILGDLRTVGGSDFFFRGADTLGDAIAAMIADDDACDEVVSVAFIT